MTTLATNPIASILSANSIPETKGVLLIETFAPFFESARELAAEAQGIKVTSADQEDEIAKARALRLRVKKLRTTAEAARKRLKEEALREGKAIDGANGLLLEKIIPVEASLTEMEQIAERLEQERRAKLTAERAELIAPYVPDTRVFDLAGMSDEAFATLHEGQKLAHEAKVRREQEEAKARAEKEAADKAERERLEAENARLQAEQAEADRIAALERELTEATHRERSAVLAPFASPRGYALGTMSEEDWQSLLARCKQDHADRVQREASLKAEREAREKAEQELREKQAEDDRKRVEAQNAQRRAEQAPDAAKLDALAVALSGIALPNCTSDKAKLAVRLVASDIENLVDQCRNHARALRT